MHAPIETPRLRLHTMTPAFLRASLSGDLRRAAALLGASLPADWPDVPDVLALRLRQLEADPRWEPWLTRVIELRGEERVVGVSGFHAPPGGDWLREVAPGGVELGYTVYGAWRRQGIAREASEALIAWAARTAGVGRFVLSMSAANTASVALARRLGFARVGTWTHEVRGEEEVYRLELPAGASAAT